MKPRYFQICTVQDRCETYAKLHASRQQSLLPSKLMPRQPLAPNN